MPRTSAAQARRVIQRTDLAHLVRDVADSQCNGKPIPCPLPDHPETIVSPSFQVHPLPDGDLWNCPYCGTGTAVDLIVRLEGMSYDDAIRWLNRWLKPHEMKPAPPRPRSKGGQGRRNGRHRRRKQRRDRSGR